MSFEEEMMDSYETIMLTDEDGTEVEFAIIDIIEADGENYILVIETAGIEDEESEAMILKKVGETEDDFNYELIEDDDEFNKIADLFAEKNEEYDVEVDE